MTNLTFKKVPGSVLAEQIVIVDGCFLGSVYRRDGGAVSWYADSAEPTRIKTVHGSLTEAKAALTGRLTVAA